MKKILFISVIVFTLNTNLTQGQVPNAGFENLNYDSTLSNWGNVYLFAVIIDSSGSSYADSIVFDQQFYSKTSDAHSGQWAMEIRNAYDFTAGLGIAGSASSSNDSVFSGFSSFNMVSVPMPPTQLSFYYKYFPLNNDSAEAHLTVFDSSYNQLGEAIVLIGGTQNNYTLASVPVTYTSSGIGSFVVMNFAASKNPYEISLGTRFLVDDVSLNETSGVHYLALDTNVSIYPNPFSSQTTISFTEIQKNTGIKVMNVIEEEIRNYELGIRNGKSITLDMSGVSKGIYFVQITDENKNVMNKKIVVE